MILSIALMFAAIGALCLLMYLCAVYALPVAFGFWAGFWALNSGAGIGGVVVGLAAGALVFTLGQLLLGTVRSPAIRGVVLLAFIGPAIYTGYSMVLQLADFAISSAVWQRVFAIIAAIAIGVGAIARLAPARRMPASSAVATSTNRPHGLQKSLLLPE